MVDSGSLILRRKKAVLASLLAFVIVVEGTSLVPSFLGHLVYFLSSQVSIIQGRWDLVALNIAVFMAFLVPLFAGFRWKVKWGSASLGVTAAFLVSLFVEMYGVPLTFYLSSALIPGSAGLGGTAGQAAIVTFEFLGQGMMLTFWEMIGAILVTLSSLLIAYSWIYLYRTDEELVTTGIYKYSRHPQYLGFLLFIFGWFVQWPSLLTMAMFPVLGYFYYRLSIVEEEEVMEQIEDKEKYREYMESTPRFI